MTSRFFLLAGEESGDQLGAALMSGLQTVCDTPQFCGVGGPAMQQRGLDSLFDYSELSVTGLAEVLPRLPSLLARIRETVDAVVEQRPTVLITIDSPDFTMRVARQVRSTLPESTIIHFVSPTIWAWRPRRAKMLREVFDHILVLFPFEPDVLAEAGIKSTFVGHPAAFACQPTADEAKLLRRDLEIGMDEPILTVLPGSRTNEVKRLCPVFGDVIARFQQQNPNYCVVVLAADSVKDLVQSICRNWCADVQIVSRQNSGSLDSERLKFVLFSESNLALAASGTVTLELAAMETPMVVAYDVHLMSRLILGRLLRIETVTLVNLVSQSKAVPELLGKECRPELIYAQLQRLQDNQAEREQQLTMCRKATELLRSGVDQPGITAAKAVLETLRFNSK